MSNRTSHVQHNGISEPSDRWNFVIANGVTIYQGAYYALLLTGYLGLPADTPGILPVGRVVGFGRGAENAAGGIPLNVTGNTSATEPPEAIVNVASEIWENVPVDGASSIGDVGLPVYLSGDNWVEDLTVTPTEHLPAIARIIRRHSATSFDVRTYSFLELARSLGLIHTQLVGLETSALEADSSANVAKWDAGARGQVLQVGWRPKGFDAGYNTGSVQLQLVIDGLPVSGAIITVPYTALDAVGDLDAFHTGTAITNTSGRADFSRGSQFQWARVTDSGGLAAITAPVEIETHVEQLMLPPI